MPRGLNCYSVIVRNLCFQQDSPASMCDLAGEKVVSDRIDEQSAVVPRDVLSGSGLEIASLTGIRFFAAMHIFWFHLLAMHKAPIPEDAMRYRIFDQMASTCLNFLEHGYCSTSLFFLLSGFILAYLYVDERRKMRIPAREFWFARFSRVYPLHIVILLLATPVALMMVPPDPKLFLQPVSRIVFFAASGLLSLTLTQAWVPECALTWNFATWALSAIVFCYILFPLAVRGLAGVPHRWWYGFMGALIGLGLLPSIIHDALVGIEQPMSFSSEFVMRTPLFWVPPFLCGMSLAMRFGVTRYAAWRPVQRTWFSLGDVVFILLIMIQCCSDKWLNDNVFAGTSSHFYMRHGLLTPVYLVLLLDLARGRGCAAWFFGLSIWKWPGTASFSIFMLQFPGGVLGSIAGSALGLAALPRFLLVNVVTLGLSIASVRYFEKPVAGWLRRRFPQR